MSKKKGRGRNQPCGCGSGRKFKRCCGPAVARAARLQSLDSDCIHAILTIARHRHGDVAVAALLLTLPGDTGDPDYSLIHFPWLAYHGEVDGVPFLDDFLEDAWDRLTPRERSWLAAQQRTHISALEVLAVRRGLGIEVKDLLTGEVRYVTDALVSESLTPSDVICGRIVDFDQSAFLCGFHPHPLPPRPGARVAAEIREVLGLDADAAAPTELLRGQVGLLLLTVWEQALEALSGRPLPALVNTDGDPLDPTEDRYTISEGVGEELLVRLTQLPGFERTPAEGPIEFVVLREGNPSVPAMENTLVGRVLVYSQELVIETNSIARADTLRAQVEAACEAFVTHTSRAQGELDPELTTAMHVGPQVAAGGGVPPELAAKITREFKQKHYATWPDIGIPALDGLTPREAAQRGGDVRKELEAVLRDLEHHEASLPQDTRFDISHLRTELGMSQSPPPDTDS